MEHQGLVELSQVERSVGCQFCVFVRQKSVLHSLFCDLKFFSRSSCDEKAQKVCKALTAVLLCESRR